MPDDDFVNIEVPAYYARTAAREVTRFWPWVIRARGWSGIRTDRPEEALRAPCAHKL